MFVPYDMMFMYFENVFIDLLVYSIIVQC